MENQVVTIKELASDLKTTPKGLRKWLRDHNINKPGKRWEWSPGDESLELIKQLRKGTKRGRPAGKVKKVKEASPERKSPTEEILFFEKGNWTVWKNADGAARAEYKGPKSTDKTPWYTEVGNVRPSLPKFIKEQLEKAINGN